MSGRNVFAVFGPPLTFQRRTQNALNFTRRCVAVPRLLAVSPVSGGRTAMWKRAVPGWVPGWLAEVSVRGATATAEIPSPRALPIIGTTADLISAGGSAKLHEYVDARHRQLGPIYREYIGPVRSVLVADPNDMRHVFRREGKYPKHLLPAPWVVYNKMYGCKRGLFFM